MSMPLKRAKEIYANYMSGLVGVAAYQEYCKKAVLEKGYITLNPLTGHKAYWWDYQACMKAQDLILHKDLNALKKFNNKLHYIQVENIDGTTRTEYLNNIMDFTNVDIVKKKISDWKKRSVNFRIQGTGALCFKNSLQLLWKYILDNNLLNIVLFCIVVHDEFDIEAPEDIYKEIANVLAKSMEDGAAPFCTKVHLGADIEINDYWVH